VECHTNISRVFPTSAHGKFNKNDIKCAHGSSPQQSERRCINTTARSEPRQEMCHDTRSNDWKSSTFWLSTICSAACRIGRMRKILSRVDMS
jgi:hypothetical protein